MAGQCPFKQIVLRYNKRECIMQNENLFVSVFLSPEIQ